MVAAVGLAGEETVLTRQKEEGVAAATEEMGKQELITVILGLVDVVVERPCLISRASLSHLADQGSLVVVEVVEEVG